MNKFYVSTTRRHYYGRNSTRSRKFFPVHYGPFDTQAEAEKWRDEKAVPNATITSGEVSGDIIPVKVKS